MRYLVIASVVSVTLGCGAAPAEKPLAAPTPKPAIVKPTGAESGTPAAPPAVSTRVFADSAEAVKALVQAVSDSNQAEFAHAQTWLVQQQVVAIPAVTDLMQDASAPMFARTAACKILSQLGPEGGQPLLDATQSDTPRVRHVATEELGKVRPASEQVTTTLLELTQSMDNEIRLAAILGLEHVDPPATDAADVMLGILNNTSEPESLRNAAKKCLKKVNPRKTFND